MPDRSSTIIIRTEKTSLYYPIRGRESFEQYLRAATEIVVEIASRESIERITYKIAEVKCETVPVVDYEIAEQDTVPGAPVILDPSDSDPNNRKVD